MIAEGKMINENDLINENETLFLFLISVSLWLWSRCIGVFEPQIQMNHRYRWTTDTDEPQIQMNHRYRWTTDTDEPQIQMTAVCFWHAVRCDRSSSSFISTVTDYFFISWCTLVYQSRVHNWVVTAIRDNLTTVSIIKNNWWQIHRYAFRNICKSIRFSVVDCLY